jgi:hypothetical protein
MCMVEAFAHFPVHWTCTYHARSRVHARLRDCLDLGMFTKNGKYRRVLYYVL